MKTILVTGGAGFIGSNFINLVLNNTIPDDITSENSTTQYSSSSITNSNSKYNIYNIINLDKLTYAANLNNLLATNNSSNYSNSSNYQFYKGDICDTALVNTILAEHNPDIIINFAAETHVDRSINNPQDFIQTNIVGTANLLACAKKFWHPNDYSDKLFFQISTDEVYGSLPLDKPELRFSETTPLAPHSPYAVSKASADLLVQSYFDTYNFPTIISRCSNNYGQHQFPEKLIPLVITRAANNLPIPVYGTGQNIRDWIYVEEHCRCILELITKGRRGEIYNIGANCEIKNIDLVKYILDIMNKPYSLIEYVADRLGHDLRYGIDASKTIEEIDFVFKNTFVFNLKKTIAWYLNN